MMSAFQQTSKKMLSEVLKGFKVNQSIPYIEVNQIESQSKSLQSGDVFLALKGVARHGIDFALNADQANAAAILFDSSDEYALQRLELLAKQIEAPLLGVENLNLIHGKILSLFHDNPSSKMKMIGVTGTDGKTSVAHLLTQALSKLDQKTGSIGTLGVGIDNQLSNVTLTTPDAVSVQNHLADFYQQRCDVVVMEVSSHALDQHRVVGTEFDCAVLTNLGVDHLDYHQTLEHYSAAKQKLFHWGSLTSRVLNVDDHLGRSLAMTLNSNSVIGYSIKESTQKADVYLASIKSEKPFSRLNIETPVGIISLRSKLIGDFNLHNLLAVVSALISMKFNPLQIMRACDDLDPIPGRMQQVNSFAQRQTIVDFAHTAQALESSLQAVVKQSQGKVWCVFGCGGDRDKSKRPEMGRIAQQYADRVIITDDNPRNEPPESIVNDILMGCELNQNLEVIHDRKIAIEHAIQNANKDDTVLIAGKGHEEFQLVQGNKVPFSDAYVALKALEAEAK